MKNWNFSTPLFFIMMTRTHKLFYLTTTLAFALLAAGQPCPDKYPFAYDNGNHCCKNNWENQSPIKDLWCDSGFISINSTCCKDDEFVKCPQPPCENAGMCTSEACKNVSERLFKNMNPEANPCHDFEKFACGKFINETKIPKTLHSAFLSESDLTKGLFERAKKMLEEEPKEESPFETDKLLRVHYKACMNLSRIEDESLPYAKKIMKYLGGFPAVEGASWDKHNHGFHWWDMVSKLPRYGLNTDMIFLFETYPDYNNTKSMALYLDQPYFGLWRGYLVKGFDHKVVKSYYEYMVGAAKIMGAENATAHEDMKDALLFEIGLANISDSWADRQDERKLYNKKPIWQLEGLPGYPPSLNCFINKIFSSAGVSGVKINDNDEVIVRNPEYAEKLSKLLDRTSSRAIANYICWRAYISFDRLMGNASRSIREVFLRKSQGIPSDPPRWVRCGRENGVGWYGERLTVALGSLYARHYFPEKDKAKADIIFDNVRIAYKRMIEDNDWMDENTKKNALEKLEAMGQNVGYRSSILKPEVLNKFFDRLKLTDSLLHNSLLISKFWIQHYLEILRLEVDRHHFIWHQWVTIVSSITIHWSNYIEFPAGGLQAPRFDPEQPMYMNHGAIGTVIAWQLMYGFQNRGRYFNKDGNLINWWSEDTLAKYNKKAQGVIDQYGNYKSEQVGLYIDGKESVGSNIADIGAAKAAYLAYENYERVHGPEKLLVGHNYTPRQLYWISLAQYECGIYTDQALRNLISWGGVPSTFRILGPLSNNPNFARDYNCPYGSKMNPCEKHNVW